MVALRQCRGPDAGRATLPAQSAAVDGATFTDTAQPSSPGDCGQRPAGTTCVADEDGYVLLVRDTIVGWDRFRSPRATVQVARGLHADYAHMLGTTLVSTTPT